MAYQRFMAFGAALILIVSGCSTQGAAPDPAPASGATAPPAPPATQPSQVGQWDIFELTLRGTPSGNPFDVRLSARFTSGKAVV